MLIQFEEYLTFENIYIFSNYGIEIVVGMIVSVLVFIFLRVLYFGCIKKTSTNKELEN